MSLRDLLTAQHRTVLEQLDSIVKRGTQRSRVEVAKSLRAHLVVERRASARFDARVRAAIEERHLIFEHLLERLLAPGSAAQRHERARLLRELLVHWFDVADRTRWVALGDALPEDNRARLGAD